jgi:NAD(P)-dependent dehydrogenase (short-subunit alcohol dehydrogenase family)
VSEPVAYDAHGRFDVSGRRVLITGAAHGLGLATATAFSGAGARVAALDRDEDGLRSIEGTPAAELVQVVDVNDDGAVREAVRECVDALGGLDVVVNAAAYYPTAPLADPTAALLMDVLETNVGGYARVAGAAHEALRESSAGRVINFASITFYLGFPPGLGAYITSKGAVIGFTRALARELGPDGVTVNAIAPGAFPTRAEEIIEDPIAYDRVILDSQSLKRRGEVDDIAGAALFLGSDASSFITGQTLVVDGGWVFN